MLSLSPNRNFVSTSKKLLKNRNWTFPVVRHFTWKLESAANTLCMIVSKNNFLFLTCPWPFKFNLFGKIVPSLRPLTQFWATNRANNLKKALKFILLDNYFLDLFAEVQISFWLFFKFSIRRFFREKSKIPCKILQFLTFKAGNKDIKTK